ncbi:MAG: cytochrome C oxidase subunit IV family protein [Candidatus Omnitrophica bacterium]|nr:hypothetical protein [bacterium]NUN95877.1 cytochrome C oxidase subunit IV family protein [Candidatus Omnitrophota bacterium]
MQPTTTVETVHRQARLCAGVFVALLCLTGITVAASFWHIGHAANVILALAIATVKAALVAIFFMHLLGEQRYVRAMAALAAILLFALIALVVWTHLDPIGGARGIA